jgi:hypothetical protein
MCKTVPITFISMSEMYDHDVYCAFRRQLQGYLLWAEYIEKRYKQILSAVRIIR